MVTEPLKDRQTATPEGEELREVPAGVTFRDTVTHVDDRGWVCEVFDPRWGWHPDPLVFVYAFTIRPGAIKGWGMHNRNVGNEDVIVVNVPTLPYNHEDPDKYRLPLDNDRIPYRFDNHPGW